MMFRIRHQRIGKVVCCNLLVGDTEGTLRLAGSFILSNEEWTEFTLHPVTRLEANESCAALCVGPLDFVPPIERDRYALILEDKCYLTTLALAAQYYDDQASESPSDGKFFDIGALTDIRSSLEPYRADRPNLSDGFLPLNFIPNLPERKFKVGDTACIKPVPVNWDGDDRCVPLDRMAGMHVEIIQIDDRFYRVRIPGGPVFFADDDMLEKVT